MHFSQLIALKSELAILQEWIARSSGTSSKLPSAMSQG